MNQRECKDSPRPIGVDLFAGAGGMSLGFEQAGFDVFAAIEIDPVHAAVHHYNFPKTTIMPKSVSQVTGTEIRQISLIGNREVDCVFGGAPCQGFSMIGQRAIDDPRNNLVKDFVRIVSELNARTFVFENVKGLTVGKHKAFLEELIESFNEIGYKIRLPYQVLNAANYGVPQSRERFFLIGSRKDVLLPNYPSPTHDHGKITGEHLKPAVTASDALRDLPNPEEHVSKVDGDVFSSVRLGKPSAYARQMRSLDNAETDLSYSRQSKSLGITGSALTKHTDITRRRFSETEPGRVEPISRFFRLHPKGQSNTLRAGTDGSRGAFTSPRPIHYKYSRCVTVREMARLHGFPDWFRLHVTKWNGARQIGNSVPPPLAKAIAEEVVLALGLKVEKPIEPVTLGPQELLSLTVTSAAEYFGVPAPDRRRNLKSGARKRKQIDIEYERLRNFLHEVAE